MSRHVTETPTLIDSNWAVCLPAGGSAINILLRQRFFDILSRENFEAAKVDGTGPFRLFWSIALPMSRPIVGVVSVFAVIAARKECRSWASGRVVRRARPRDV